MKNTAVKNNINNNKGFTLVELLLTVALMGISFGVTSDILLTIMRSFNKTTVMGEIEQQANFVNEKMEKELRNSNGVTLDSSNTIHFKDPSGSIVYYDIDLTAGHNVLYRSVGSTSRVLANAVTMNSYLVANTVGGVNVTCPSNCFTVSNGKPDIVQYNMVFTQAQASPNSSYTGQVTLSNTVVVRNTY
jgi:prepilin-type N-terminal cleavage/methylation domain-containing protein